MLLKVTNKLENSFKNLEFIEFCTLLYSLYTMGGHWDAHNIQADFNPFMASGLFYLKSLEKSISNIGDVWLVYIITNHVL